MKRQLIDGRRVRLNRSSRSRVKMRERRIRYGRRGASVLTPAQIRNLRQRYATVEPVKPEPAPCSRPPRRGLFGGLLAAIAMAGGTVIPKRRKHLAEPIMNNPRAVARLPLSPSTAGPPTPHAPPGLFLCLDRRTEPLFTPTTCGIQKENDA